MKLFNRRKKDIKTKTCIIGMCPGIGVTHICLCLANYLHSVKGRQVMYVEVGKQSRLKSFIGNKEKIMGNIIAYEYKGMSYVISSSYEEASRILKEIEMDIIIDLGELTKENKDIFLQCDRKILVSSLQPWMSDRFVESIRKIKRIYDIKAVIIINNLEKRKNTKKKYKECDIRNLPCIENPFLLEEENFASLENVLT